MDQGERITEVIFLQSDVSEKMLMEARKKTKPPLITKRIMIRKGKQSIKDA